MRTENFRIRLGHILFSNAYLLCDAWKLFDLLKTQCLHCKWGNNTIRLMEEIKRCHYLKDLKRGLRWRENTNKSSYKEFLLPAWHQRPYFISFPLLGLSTVLGTEHLLSIPFWMGLKWYRKDVRTQTFQDAQRSQATWIRKEERWTKRKLPVDGLFLLYLLCSGFFSHYLISVLLSAASRKRK